jgi:hypothetical protein
MVFINLNSIAYLILVINRDLKTGLKLKRYG